MTSTGEGEWKMHKVSGRPHASWDQKYPSNLYIGTMLKQVFTGSRARFDSSTKLNANCTLKQTSNVSVKNATRTAAGR